jgi:hypothetical protein
VRVLGPDDVENFVEKPAPVTATKWGLLKKKKILNAISVISRPSPLKDLPFQIKSKRRDRWTGTRS